MTRSQLQDLERVASLPRRAQAIALHEFWAALGERENFLRLRIPASLREAASDAEPKGPEELALEILRLLPSERQCTDPELERFHEDLRVAIKRLRRLDARGAELQARAVAELERALGPAEARRP